MGADIYVLAEIKLEGTIDVRTYGEIDGWEKFIRRQQGAVGKLQFCGIKGSGRQN